MLQVSRIPSSGQPSHVEQLNLTVCFYYWCDGLFLWEKYCPVCHLDSNPSQNNFKWTGQPCTALTWERKTANKIRTPKKESACMCLHLRAIPHCWAQTQSDNDTLNNPESGECGIWQVALSYVGVRGFLAPRLLPVFLSASGENHITTTQENSCIQDYISAYSL